MEQNLCFFHQKSESIAFTFCRYLYQNMRALHLLFAGTYIRIWGHLYSAGIALQLYSAVGFERLKWVQKSRAIPWDFWDEVFSLSVPSVCPHLTTVCLFKNFCAGTKTNFTECKSSYISGFYILDCKYSKFSI
jgi:hypothetical protein